MVVFAVAGGEVFVFVSAGERKERAGDKRESVKRPTRRALLTLTSPAKRVENPLASNDPISATPDRPSRRLL